MDAEYIARYVYDFHFDALPEHIRQRIKMCALDTFGAIIAGTGSEVSRIMLRMSQFTGAQAQATDLCVGQKVSLASAALINGFTANALDVDDGQRLVKGHPGAVLLPPILAVAEYVGASGKAFLEALACAYEVGIRAGIAWHKHFDPFYHGTGSWGAVAGAAACAKLLGLAPEGIQRAMGIAEYHTVNAPVLNICAHPSMLKDGIGWGCMVACLSALMAQEGFTSSPCMLDAPAYADVFSNVNQKYEIETLYFKPFCCCRWAQPAVTAALALKARHDFKPEEVERITITTFREAATLSTKKPKKTDEAQYNIFYPLSAALCEGEVGPRQVFEEGLHNPAILALMDKMECETSEEYQRDFPKVCKCALTVRLSNGTVLLSGPTQAKGDAETIESDAFFTDKFRWLTKDAIDAAMATEIIRRTQCLDLEIDIGSLIRILHPAKREGER